MRGRAAGLPALAFVALVLAISCASPKRLHDDLHAYLAAQNYADAVVSLEEQKGKAYKEKDSLLFFLEDGMLLHLAGQYARSNQALEEAKRLADELYTRSVIRETAAFLTNDNALPYYGANFERALVHVISALNYALLGELESAAVEARQVDVLLKKLVTDYGQKNVYKQDAFARYLTGMLYESMQDWDDAYIAYWQALEAYEATADTYGVEAPPALRSAAAAVAVRLGQHKVAELEQRWGAAAPRELPTGTGEVVIVHYNGMAPEKVEQAYQFAFGDSWAYVDAQQASADDAVEVDRARRALVGIAAEESITVAFPKYVPTPYLIRSAEAESGGVAVSAELVQNVGAVAMRDLDDHIARIRTKAIARAAVKYAIGKAVSESVSSQDATAGLMVNIFFDVFNAVTEQADTRYWFTLPDTIELLHLVLPEGTHDVTVRFLSEAGSLVDTRTLSGVTVESGRRTFATVRTVN